MKLSFTVFALLILFPMGSWGQSRITQLQGFIYDSQYRAVEGARISAGDSAKSSTQSDVDGHFMLQLVATVKPGSSVALHIEKTGYRSITKDEPVSELTVRVILTTEKRAHQSHSAATGIDKPSTLGTPRNSVQSPAQAPVASSPAATSTQTAQAPPTPSPVQPIGPSPYARVHASVAELAEIVNDYRGGSSNIVEGTQNQIYRCCRFGEPPLTQAQLDSFELNEIQSLYDRGRDSHDRYVDWLKKFGPIRQDALNCMDKMTANKAAADNSLFVAALAHSADIWDLNQIKKDKYDAKRFDPIFAYAQDLAKKVGDYVPCGR